jgi:hypothetical protein
MIDMAESGETMYSSHSCMKTHFVKDRLVQLVYITTNVCQDCQPGLTLLQEIQRDWQQSDLG